MMMGIATWLFLVLLKISFVMGATGPIEMVLREGELTATLEVVDNTMLGVSVTYTGTKSRWIGFGWTKASLNPMYASESVLGTDGIAPTKFKMTSDSLDGSGVTPFPSSQQTLINATWTVDAGKTTMKFYKLLKEENEIEILVGERMYFIWALGLDDAISYHWKQGVTATQLSLGTSISLEVPFKKEFQAHGILAVIAWAVLVPLAVAASTLRDLLPKGPIWLKIHMACNVASAIFTVISFALAVHVYGKLNTKHFSSATGKSIHQAMGLFIFLAVICQVVSGIFRPHLPKSPAATEGSQELKGKETLKETADDVEDNAKAEEEPAIVEEKSMTRKVWEVGHKLMGYFFLGLCAWQIHEGIKLYGIKYDQNVDNMKKAFLGFFCAFVGIVALLKAYLLTKKE